MNLRIIVFYITILLSSIIVVGQEKDLLPLELPPQLFAEWENEEEQVVLVITKDYLIVEDEIWYYKYINTDNDIRISITCTNENQINVFQLFVNEFNKIYFHYGRKHLELLKGDNNINVIPDFLLGNWMSSENIINIKNKGLILYKDEVFVCDYIAKIKDNEYNLILYKSGKYYLLGVNKINEKWIIEAFDLTNQRFFKESVFQKYYSMLLVSGVLLSLALFYFLFKWKIRINKNKEEVKRKFAEIQLKSIRSQMNPHFLFNALSAIQNLINKNENDRANHYLTEFSKLMRLTLDKSEKGLVPLIDEIESIKKYLDLENLRFKFKYSLKIDPEIDSHQIEIPAMLVQPFVENAIIHGLNGSGGNKKLDIEFKKQGDYLQCLIKDNGIGVKASKAKKGVAVKKIHYGHKLAEDRISLINESHNTNAKIVITDLSDNSKTETGTLIELLTPLNY